MATKLLGFLPDFLKMAEMGLDACLFKLPREATKSGVEKE